MYILNILSFFYASNVTNPCEHVDQERYDNLIKKLSWGSKSEKYFNEKCENNPTKGILKSEKGDKAKSVRFK